MNQSEPMPCVAAGLGYGGLVPFVAAAIAVVTGFEHIGGEAFIAYGAVILAFLGGIQWGLAFHLGGDAFSERLAVGVTPGLLAWVALLLPFATGVALLAVGFLAIYAYDRYRNAPALPAWFGRLRGRLTVVVFVCHLAVLGVSLF